MKNYSESKINKELKNIIEKMVENSKETFGCFK